MTYEQLLEHYFNNHELRHKTELSYRAAINKLKKNIHCSLEELNKSEILKWRKRELERGLSPISWNCYIRHLKAIFSFGLDKHLIGLSENSFKNLMVTSPKKKTLDSFQLSLVVEEFEKMKRLEISGEHCGRIRPVWFWRVVFETFHHTGMRRNQLLHLRVGDIDLNKQLIHTQIEGSKTHLEYDIPITNALRPWMVLVMQHARLACFRRNDQLFNITRFSESNRFKCKKR